MINLSLDGVQQLLRGDAVCSDDGVNIVRVLNIQASLCAASIEKNCNHSTVMGINGGMVSAGVGAVSNFGNSLLSGFGILGNGNNNAGKDTEQEVRQSAVTPHAHSSNRSLKEDTAISIRILQTLVMIIGSESLILTEEVLSSCISICLLLGFLENEECVNLGMGVRSGNNQSGNVGGGGSKRKDFQEHNSNNSNSSEGGAQGSLKKVSRVAIATLRQIVSTVFNRAAAARGGVAKPPPQRIEGNEESNWGPDNLHVQEVASRLLEDLCEITGSGAIHANVTSELQKRCSGPFGQAMVGQQHRILPPPMSICFDLIEMIVEQQVELLVDHTGVFLSIMRDRLCPIIMKRLSFGSTSGATSDVGPPVSTDSNHDRTITQALKLTSLTLTIINSYGLKEQLRAECKDLLISLTKLVDSATDVLRDSHEFEVSMLLHETSSLLISALKIRSLFLIDLLGRMAMYTIVRQRMKVCRINPSLI